MIAACLLGADAHFDRNARRAQPRMAFAGDFGIGVLERRYDARNARRDDSVGARRRLAVVRAGLQRDVQRGAARRRAGAPQCLDLGMGPATSLRPAAADNDAVLDDHRADGGVRPGPPQPAPAERKRQRHEAHVVTTAGGRTEGGHGEIISAPSRPAANVGQGKTARLGLNLVHEVVGAGFCIVKRPDHVPFGNGV